MGRHRAMVAKIAHSEDAIRHLTIDAEPATRRRLTSRTVPDTGRWRSLKSCGIRRPDGPLRDAAIEVAALVWAHTPPRSAHADGTGVRNLAQFLYDEAVLFGIVDEERALTREKVDEWLGHQCPGSLWSLRTYRTDLYAAGRVLYPREYPEPQSPLAPRPRVTQPAPDSRVAELYAAVTHLSDVHQQQALVILDLVTGAGLSSSQIRALTGTGVSGLDTPMGAVAVVSVSYLGTITRRTPVLCPVRSRRLLDRAAEVGEGRLLPGARDRNGANRVNEVLAQRGLPTIDVPALRGWWLVSVANRPGMTVAGFLAITGTTGVRSIGEISEYLPVADLAELATRLMAGEQR